MKRPILFAWLLVLAVASLLAGLSLFALALHGEPVEPWERFVYGSYLIVTAIILVLQSDILRKQRKGT